ncbi:MAG: hypothetical protein ACF8TS_20225 [Maioricimonas sp. JB049]
MVAPSLHPDTRSARELLERWSSEELLRPETPAASDRGRDTDDHGPAPPHDEPPLRRSQPKFRIDSAHERVAEPGARRPAARPRSRVALANELPPGMRAHYAHDEVPPPHFKVQRPARAAADEPGRSEAFWGQLLAYGGVAVLTIGTCLVLLGYFGGQPSYAPTGWLITTAGQMLLFLGVVTLVSGGMQQTAHEVAQRVEYLDGRMLRIEDSTQEMLRGPQFNRHRDRRTGAADEDADGSCT